MRITRRLSAAVPVSDLLSYGSMCPMPSWRDSASQLAQDDLDGLLDAALPFAQEMLAKHGEFFPYGAATTAAGETKLIAADPDEGEQPESMSVLASLVEGLQVERDALRATALVSDVRLADSDAIRVELEHREGHSIIVAAPVQKEATTTGLRVRDVERRGRRASNLARA